MQHYFNGTFLPSAVSSIAQWDGGDLLNLGSQLRGTFWAYLTIRTWAPEGPFKSDYVVTNSDCQVLLTIEGVEFLLLVLNVLQSQKIAWRNALPLSGSRKCFLWQIIVSPQHSLSIDHYIFAGYSKSSLPRHWSIRYSNS